MGGRRGWLGVACGVLLLIAWLIVHLVHTRLMVAQLLRADPALIVQNADLRDFALARAKPAYAGNCATCHGATLQGDPARGIPNLADTDFLYGSGEVAEIEHTILYGIRSGNPKGWDLASMPAYATPVPYAKEKIGPLMPPDIVDVTEYLLTLEQRPADAAAAERGAAIFAGRGGCYDCHSTDGKGDSAIGAPNLTDSIWLYGDGSRDSMFRSIAYGHRGVCPAWVDRLDPATIRALAVYLHVASHP